MKQKAASIRNHIAMECIPQGTNPHAKDGKYHTNASITWYRPRKSCPIILCSCIRSPLDAWTETGESCRNRVRTKARPELTVFHLSRVGTAVRWKFSCRRNGLLGVFHLQGKQELRKPLKSHESTTYWSLSPTSQWINTTSSLSFLTASSTTGSAEIGRR